MAFSLLFSFWFSFKMNKAVFLWVGVDLNSVHNLKIESYILELLVGGFSTSSPGGSIASDPERTTPGWELGARLYRSFATEDRWSECQKMIVN